MVFLHYRSPPHYGSVIQPQSWVWAIIPSTVFVCPCSGVGWGQGCCWVAVHNFSCLTFRCASYVPIVTLYTRSKTFCTITYCPNHSGSSVCPFTICWQVRCSTFLLCRLAWANLECSSQSGHLPCCVHGHIVLSLMWPVLWRSALSPLVHAPESMVNTLWHCGR
jgi:hypothetical protein